MSSQASQVLQSQAHIWNHIFSFINSMTLKCAIQLEIPDIVDNHDGPITLPELVESLSINKAKSHCVYRLMRMLVHSGFFSISKTVGKNEEEGYLLAPASRLLLKNESSSLRPFLLAILDPFLTRPWHHVSEWFRNDDPSPFHTAHGRTLWDYAAHEPMLNHFFNEAMASDSRLVTSVVIKSCSEVFEGLTSIVDVAGGTGTVTKAIADAFPNLKCINFDLPHVIAGLEGSKNLSYVGGDMFEAVPAADAILLKWILHDWDDEECVKILKRCKEAIRSNGNGGKVIIIDMIVDNEKGEDASIETQLFWDMSMMVSMTGKERNKKEWAKLFSDADFSGYKIAHNLGLRSLIEVYLSEEQKHI